jgi:glucose/arabinose dehydrogenase
MGFALRRLVFALALLTGIGFDPAIGSPMPLAANLPMSPLSQGYSVEDAFPEIPSLYAIGIHVPQGETNRLFFGGKAGVVTVISNLALPTVTTFLDLSAKTYAESECGLLGLAFHPGWRTNRQFFVYYSTVAPWDGTNALQQRLSRFLIDPNNPNRALPESEAPLFSQFDPEPSHQAGDLEFGPDGYLYVSVGDGGGAWDTFHNSQKIDGGFFSGILRLDVDARPGSLAPNPHPGLGDGAYRIPPDNPFVGAKNFLGAAVAEERVRTEFWAVGLRNPFRMSFNPKTGALFANDTGQNRREEIDRILPGHNYGWVFLEGSLVWPFGVPNGAEFTGPVFEYEHDQGRVAITGGHWYFGSRYPRLDGAYIFADIGGPIGALTFNDSGRTSVNWIARSPGIADIGTNPRTGDLIFASLDRGRIRKLTFAESGTSPLPTVLSATGLFSDVKDLTPAPGLHPYEINHPFWSDLAVKRRWVGLLAGADPIGFSSASPWSIGPGTVFVKHFDLATNPNPAVPARRVETRVLVRNTQGMWGATYRWRTDGSEADLVPPEGLDEDIPIVGSESSGLVRTQSWRYPARDECLACHNSAAGHALGFNTAQLNLQTGGESQLHRLAALGYLSGLPPATEHLPRLAALADPTAGIGYRVRSYLAANCAYCHFPGGPTRANWDARLTTPLADAGIVDAPALNNLGDVYGRIPTPIVFTGKPEQSSLFLRLANLEPYHMPPLGTSVVNTNAVELIRHWVTATLPQNLSYPGWQTNHFSAPPGPDAAPGADPDSDGLPNELEWLLGENPKNPARSWNVFVAEEGSELVLRFEHRAGLLMQVESGDPFTAAPWITLPLPGNRFDIPATDMPAEVRVPLTDGETRFFRIAVTRL